MIQKLNFERETSSVGKVEGNVSQVNIGNKIKNEPSKIMSLLFFISKELVARIKRNYRFIDHYNL